MDGTEAREPLVTGGVVTFLDVLGWNGIYVRQNNAISNLTRLVEGLRQKTTSQRGKVPQDTLISSISDTIVIHTRCGIKRVSDAIQNHGDLVSWVIPRSIEAGIPVRGAIAYGDYEYKGNIFAGKAVDEAAAWHEHADWIGAHLTPSAEFVFKGLSNRTWIKYTPPHKTPISWNICCVDWTAQWVDRDLEKEAIVAGLRALGPIVPEIAVKFANTLAFIDAPRPRD